MGMGAKALTSAPPVLPTGYLPVSDPGPATTMRNSWPMSSCRSRRRSAAREHRDVRAHVRAGQRLADDVGAFEVRPLSTRVAVRTGGAGAVDLDRPRGTQLSAGVGGDAVRTHSRPSSGDGERGTLPDELSNHVDERGGRLRGRAGVERRLRVVLDGELDHLRHLRSVHAVEQHESHVDAARDTGRGDYLAALDYAVRGVVRAELLERRLADPVRRCIETVEDPRGREVDGARADARRPCRRRVHRTEPRTISSDWSSVSLRPPGTTTTSGFGTSANDCRRDERRSAGVVDDRAGLGRDEHDLVAGHIGEDLERPDDVEHREVRVERECDLHRASSGVGCGACHAFMLALWGLPRFGRHPSDLGTDVPPEAS